MPGLKEHFDSAKSDLRKLMEATPNLENAMKLMNEYLSKVHRELSKSYNLKESRQLGYLLEIVRFSVGSIKAVDKMVSTFPVDYTAIQTKKTSTAFITFGKTVQFAVALTLLITLLSMDPTPWIPIFLCGIFIGIEAYLILFKSKDRFFLSPLKRIFFQGAGKRNMPDHAVQQKVDVQLVMNIPSLLNHVADSFSLIDKLLDEKSQQKEVTFLEKEIEILKIFQDFFEAKYFNDPEWALKKVSSIHAILQNQGIMVKKFDPKSASDRNHFDFEPAVDPSIKDYVTISPALIKDERTLLRGKVAEPFSD